MTRLANAGERFPPGKHFFLTTPFSLGILHTKFNMQNATPSKTNGNSQSLMERGVSL
jgi:hypothetical protein